MSRRFTSLPVMSRSLALRRLALLSLLTAALCLAPARTGRAASFLYGTHQRTINAGVLFNGSASTPIAPQTPPVYYAPPSETYVFQILNQRSDIKPFGWNIVNPRAPGTITSAIQTRWGRPTPISPYYYPVGQVVSPNMAAYWEVPINDVSADQLQQYDILYLPSGGSGLSVADNEKLRRFVDGGGQLWVSGAGPSFTDTAVGPGGAGLLPPPTNLATQPFARNPLLTSPFFLSYNDFSTLGYAATTNAVTSAGGGDFVNLYANVLVQAGGSPPPAGVVAAQYGGGQVVADSLDIGGAINDFVGDANTPLTVNPFRNNNGPYFGNPGSSRASLPNIFAAPTQDLKFLCNLIAGVDNHPNENKNPHQNAADNDLASFAPAWSYPTPTSPIATTATNAPPGAAVFGNFVYVTTADGVLHAFDAYPAEDLTHAGSIPDDGLPDFSGTPGTAYDEIWHTPSSGTGFLGLGASAPTVATYGGQTFVLVETASGNVFEYFAFKGPLGGVAYKIFSAKIPTSFPAGVNSPSPTYYEGRVFAGQADGTLLVGNLKDGSSSSVVLLGGGATEAITASPAVGIIPDGAMTNDIVAVVPGTQNMYSVLLGARADPLLPVGPATAPTGYNVNRSRLYSPNGNSSIISLTNPSAPFPNSTYKALGPSQAYLIPPSGAPAYANSSQPDFTPATAGSYYADWNADIATMYPTDTNPDLNHTVFSAFTPGAATTGTPTAILSAPAFGKNGDFYYTETTGANSYLICAHDAAQLSRVQMRWRFRMPTAGDGPIVDADGVDYSQLVGFTFVGAPVVDNQGNVYAVATGTTTTGSPPSGVKAATVLCFSTNATVYADLPGSITDPSQATFTQADEDGGAAPNSLRPGNLDGLDANGKPIYGQYVVNGRQVVFYNFAVAAYNGVPRQVAGNLSEPQVVVATPAEVPGQDGTQTTTPTPLTLSLHTNLEWFAVGPIPPGSPAGTPYKPFPVSGNILGLSKVGGTLFLTDGAYLYRIPSAPAVISGKLAVYDPTPALNLNNPVGTVLATRSTPSIGGNVMVLNGVLSNGTSNTVNVQVYTQQLTLIADNNRILEVDSDGSALWAVDSTLQDTGAATHVGFSHPVSLSQVALNDYLVADTGNNRCVRFDRAGKTLWELTRFTDSGGLLKLPGEPTTLNNPTSVQMRQETAPSGNVLLHYLIADSGNHRIVEVTDTYDPNGVLTASHILTGVSHTDDVQGRKYRYGSATYYDYTTTAGVTLHFVAALVTNTRLAPLSAAGALGPASADAPGSSIVLLGYVPGSAAGPSVGDIQYVFTSFQDGTGQTHPMHDARFLSVYTPPGVLTAANPASLLYADGNGAFDLTLVGSTLVTSSSTNSPPFDNLSFDNASYQSMTTIVAGVPTATPLPLNTGIAPAPARTAVSFQPSCIQRLGMVNSHPSYLVTQSNGSPELGNSSFLFGGEVFEVDYNTYASKYIAVPTYSGGTLARPALTSPLTQPTFAIRPQ